MSGLRSINQEWREYARNVFDGVRVSEVKIRETQKAFHAGFMALLFQLREIGCESDEVAVAHYNSLVQEVERFLESQGEKIFRCRVCGCTDFRACKTEAGTCHWVTDDLCSACDLSDL